MSKPEDIPQDVWDAAERAWQASYATRGMRTGLTFAPVARAIMAAKAEEREACAVVCEYQAVEYVDTAVRSLSLGSSEEHAAKSQAAVRAAAAIRKRGEA